MSFDPCGTILRGDAAFRRAVAEKDVTRRENFDLNYPKDFRELIARLRRDHPAAMLIPTTAIPLNADLAVDEPKAKRMNA